MTEKRFTLELYEGTIRIKAIKDYGEIIYPPKIVELLNELHEENIKLKKVIEEEERVLQSTYDELTKLRCIKKNLGRVKSQWDWIMEVIQYD